jgi:hypothetical protein
MHVPNEAQMFEIPRLRRFTPRVNAAYGKHAADPYRDAFHQLPGNGCVEVRAAAFARHDIA